MKFITIGTLIFHELSKQNYVTRITVLNAVFFLVILDKDKHDFKMVNQIENNVGTITENNRGIYWIRTVTIYDDLFLDIILRIIQNDEILYDMLCRNIY
uniref:Uncharacterized protein n=1 Tax=Onchocerca volvulus TaxID=6282 RepID=A0A8R1TLD2_ONCVO